MCQTIVEVIGKLTETKNRSKINIPNHRSLSHIGNFMHDGDSFANIKVS